MPSLRDELGRTMPAADYLAPAQAAAALDLPNIDGQTPTSDRPGVSDRLQQLGYPFPHRARIEFGDQLGAGATARVFAALDHDLERPVAVKMLVAQGRPSAEAVSGFIEEARITASLSHPNVLPVHEVEVNGSGQIFFTMKRVDGRSLGSALEQSGPGSRQPPLDDPNAVVNVFIGVGQALAYAHRRRVVHQDVKPDNIMLGEFGEVLLVDWGSARRLDQPGGTLYGTPLYMSPEQARGEGADERSDVYCLGATLFHALVLRLPTWSDVPERFWELKRAGRVEPPTAAERAAMPPALLAIAMKALAPRPAERYQQAGELIEDLRRYQAGLAVSALRESLLQRARRWHCRHARTFWAWSTAALVVLALAGALYGERLKDLARWGAPQVETFTPESLTARWEVIYGGFHVADGRVISEQDYNVITLRDPIQGAAAIEYDGEILAGHHAADVSLMWSRGYDPNGKGFLRQLVDGCTIQYGAWDGAYSGIAVGIDPREMVAQCGWRPPVGRPFHARVEIEDNRIRMLVDGREICGWSDPFPLEGGYLSLFAIGAGKAYGNLRIYRREVPARVSAVAVGDEAARGKAYDIAAAAYLRIVASHGDDALGREALYKLGLCRWRQGRPDEALTTWQAIVSGPYAGLVRLHRLEHAFDEGRHDEVLAALPGLYRAADATDRNHIALQWGRWIDRVRGEKQNALVARYLEVHDAIMADQPIADHSAAESLIMLGRGDELMRRYPNERYLCTVVLSSRGEYDRVIRDYPDQRWPCTSAAFLGGIWEGQDPELSKGLNDESLWMRGRAEELLARNDVAPLIRAHALNSIGRYAEALEVMRQLPQGPADAGEGDTVVHALIGLGRFEEAAAKSELSKKLVALATGEVGALSDDPNPEFQSWARTILAIQALAAGDRPRWRALMPPRREVLGSRWSLALDQWLLCPLVPGIESGDFSQFDSCCAELAGRWRYLHRQRLSTISRFVRGECGEEAVQHEPCVIYGEVDLALARALLAERHRDRDNALAAWRAYQATPPAARNLQFDAGREAFVTWRIAELSAVKP